MSVAREKSQSAQKLNISPLQSDLLDLSRWVAAFFVVIEHLRSLIFLPYGEQSHIGIIGKVFYFLTGFGHEAVMIFFVMSGFLVGGKILERLSNETFIWQRYALDRTSRLYAVYIVALLLGGTLDYIGYQHFNSFGLYDNSFSGQIAVVNHDYSKALSFSTLSINLAMCQTVLGPVFGSNGPLWSLANEFWYYLIGPVLFALFWNNFSRRTIVRLIALAAVFWFLPIEILVYFLVWLFGAALYFMNHRAMVPVWSAILLLAGSLTVARLECIKTPFIANFFIGISFALLVNSLACKRLRLPLHDYSRRAAGFSYSVYLCHFPILVFFVSALHQVSGIGIGNSLAGTSSGLFLLVLFAVYACSFFISLATERQTPLIRQWLYYHFDKSH